MLIKKINKIKTGVGCRCRGHGLTSLTMGEEVEEVQKIAEGGNILKAQETSAATASHPAVSSRSPLLSSPLPPPRSSTAAREVC